LGRHSSPFLVIVVKKPFKTGIKNYFDVRDLCQTGPNSSNFHTSL
jgi:hypothetical protein